MKALEDNSPEDLKRLFHFIVTYQVTSEEFTVWSKWLLTILEAMGAAHDKHKNKLITKDDLKF